MEVNPTRKEEFRLPQKTKLFPGRGHQLILRRLEDADGAMRQIQRAKALRKSSRNYVSLFCSEVKFTVLN